MNSDPYQRRSRGRLSGGALAGVLAASLVFAGLFTVARGISAVGAPTATQVVEFCLVLLVLVLLNGFFVASETAIEVLKGSHSKSIGQGDERSQAAIADMLVRKASFVAACSLGSMTLRAWIVVLAVVPSLSLSEWMRAQWPALASWAGDGQGATVLIAMLVLAIPVVALNVVLGELVPKSYAAQHPVETSLRVYNAVRFFNSVFAAPIAVFVTLGGLVTRRFGAKATFALNQTEEEIIELLEEAEESGEIEEEEREMVASVFEFGDTVVREVMTPRVDLEAVPIEATLAEVAKLVEETGHSRIPVYEGTDDTILGIVHAKDVLSALMDGGTDRPLSDIVRPTIFVPESKPLHDLLQEMRQGRAQMAVVQDEHSGTAGIVTIEDIVEEVMGEIVDEYDEDLPQIVGMDDGFVSDGRMELDDVNAVVGSSFESVEFDTIGGYVFGMFGRQPKEGEYVEHAGLRFTVRETDGKRIMRLWIERLPETPAREESPTS